ncbi:MAG: hypothetical protein ACI4HO_09215 [Ruminococcus sp.]
MLSKLCLLELKPNVKYELNIKQTRLKRSLDANAYAWVLIHKISDAISTASEPITPVDIYREVILRVGSYEVVPIRNDVVKSFTKKFESSGIGWIVVNMGNSKIKGYTNLRIYHGSSTFDTKEMSKLINELISEASELDIDVVPEQEVDRLITEWGNDIEEE